MACWKNLCARQIMFKIVFASFINTNYSTEQWVKNQYQRLSYSVHCLVKSDEQVIGGNRKIKGNNKK